MLGVRDKWNRWVESPEGIEETLWRSRESTWDSATPLPGLAQTLLEHFFQDREMSLSELPSPAWETLAATVLEPAGSAPGRDNEPYEVYLLGIRFVAYPLGHPVWAAARSDHELARVLGPAIDLLVWILKKPGAEFAADMRPLQLLTCFRWLFGAYTAGVLGPVVGPLLSKDQAATADGFCGRNVEETFAHLARCHPEPGDSLPTWQLLVGANGPALERAIMTAAAPDLAGLPAFFFADQSNAFERLSLAWYALVLRGWGLPP